jgi:hypothetical protein
MLLCPEYLCPLDSDHLLKDLKKLNKQQAAVRKVLDKP